LGEQDFAVSQRDLTADEHGAVVIGNDGQRARSVRETLLALQPCRRQGLRVFRIGDLGHPNSQLLQLGRIERRRVPDHFSLPQVVPVGSHRSGSAEQAPHDRAGLIGGDLPVCQCPVDDRELLDHLVRGADLPPRNREGDPVRVVELRADVIARESGGGGLVQDVHPDGLDPCGPAVEAMDQIHGFRTVGGGAERLQSGEIGVDPPLKLLHRHVIHNP